MNAELEALLKAYDAFMQAAPELSEEPWEVYQQLLVQISLREGVSDEVLHRAVKAKYFPWLRAQQHPPSLPPKA